MLKSSREIKQKLREILPSIQKPGRYVGGELNHVCKDWESVKTRVALVFPDIYDIGVPNLGLMILYELINNRPDALCERAYVPWLDMEKAMRTNGIPLYALESKNPLSSFDIIGFSLAYETLYTNVLNALDLAGIPLRTIARSEKDPLIIAGGQAAYNPEPMSAFIDAFVIGEGEEVIQEIITCTQNAKDKSLDREATLRSLALIKGVYVPAFYEPVYNPDGTLNSINSTHPDTPVKIEKRICAKLPDPPTRFLVPSIDVVHNRIAIEIMRGCTRGCRFCHAGMVNRPVRERSVGTIINSIEKSLNNTGYEEIALLSLSSSDYTHISELVDRIQEKFCGKNLSISLPSLRIESFSVTLMEKLKGARHGGFTLAPEAATDAMRNIINKPISEEQLLQTTGEIFSNGWQSIKLYFMIGQPGESIEDVQAIAQLCRKVMVEGRRRIGKRATLHIGVSTFVPKPHTPFQWAAMDPLSTIFEKLNMLKDQLRFPGMRMTWSNPQESLLEAVLSRGDRRISDVIESAWKNGAKFDAWQDQFNYQAWLDALQENHLSPDFYAYRERTENEVFPWDHINSGVSKNFLAKEYLRSKKGQLTDDCREKCTACGILPAFADIRRQLPGDAWFCPEVI